MNPDKLRGALDAATPGPWWWDIVPMHPGFPESEEVVFVDSAKTFIASTHLPPTEPRAVLDAALIAAAPQLAQAVLAVLDLHAPDAPESAYPLCVHCEHEYPCEVVRRITEALR